MIQKLYINNNYVTISYLVFINIAPNNVTRFKVIIFINKNNIEHVIIISKPDTYQDPNIQMLNIFRDDLLNIRLFNIYNEK